MSHSTDVSQGLRPTDSRQPVNTTRSRVVSSPTQGASRTVSQQRVHLRMKPGQAQPPRASLHTIPPPSQVQRQVQTYTVAPPMRSAPAQVSHFEQHQALGSTLQHAHSASGSLMALLDTAFRGFQTELTNLRNLCTRAVVKEKEEKEKWKSHCVTFKQERDIARIRVRALIGEREANFIRADASDDEGRSRGVKRGRTVSEVAPDGSIASGSRSVSPTGGDMPQLSYPSPTSPTLGHASETGWGEIAPIAGRGDGTSFDVTVVHNPGRRICTEHPSKRRRQSGGEPSIEHSVALQGDRTIDTLGLGEADMELGSEFDTSDSKDGDKALASPLAAGSPKPATPKMKPKPEIELTHVDLMYVPMNGKLVCRVCLLHASKPANHSQTPTSFPTDSPWDTLRDHCVQEHPKECTEMARLHPSEVYELRRRMMLIRPS